MKKYILATCILFCVQSISQSAFAQNTDTTKLKHKKNIFTLALYKQPGKDSMVDVVDGIYRILKINKDRSIADTITKTQISLVPGIEYSLATKFATSLSASVMVPGKLSTTKASTFSGEIKYTQNKQAVALLVSNIWLKNNKYNINTNWSFLKYPQQDFGIGTTNNQLSLVDDLSYSYIRMYQSIVKKIGRNFYVGPGINIDNHWQIKDSTTINKPITGFQQYGFTGASKSIGITLNALYDTRTSIVNPKTNSSFINLSYRNNLTALGSDQNWQTLLIDVRKYVPFPKNSKNILAFWTYNVLTLQGKGPYLDLPTTAGDTYGNTGRGYIQGRFRGDKYISAESEYRFGITENGALGGVVFANIQSVSGLYDKSLQGLKKAIGAGFRFKINKHSHTNVAIDYAVGEDGSKGIFMNLGEVF